MIVTTVTLALVMDHLLRPDAGLWTLTLLYVGPDQILPLASFLSAFVGVILIFWRYLVGLVKRAWHTLVKRS
jgi:hypothetical protein